MTAGFTNVIGQDLQWYVSSCISKIGAMTTSSTMAYLGGKGWEKELIQQ
jgi:hypothetical protein